MIVIVDTGVGNKASVLFALQRFGIDAVITSDAKQIKRASRVIIPGVSSAVYTMKQLKKLQLIDALRSLKTPVLGICLGMQLFYEFSEEGNVECLGVIPGAIKKMVSKKNRSIPHIGWNKLHIVRDSMLLDGIKDQSHVYFVHSYAVEEGDTSYAVTHYGESFTAVCEYENFYGVQFHPERSGEVGEKILKNFLII